MSDYHIKTDESVHNLAAAVFVQAYEDWAKLCRLLSKGYIRETDGHLVRGSKAPKKFNMPNFSFVEIRDFVNAYAEHWVEINPNHITDKLETMRRKALYEARRHY